MKEPVHKGEDSRESLRSWESIWSEFEPFKSRLIEDLGTVNTIQEKILFLKKERKRLDSELSKLGFDLYKPPISLFFDNSFIFLNDSLLSSNEKKNTKKSNLKWSADTTHFLELIVALDQSKSISLIDNGRLSRKELISQLCAFFNIEPISNYESRIHKLKIRSNKTPFLDKLKEVFTLFSNGDKAR